MPISVILIGIFIILINFKISKNTYSQFKTSFILLETVSVLAFIFLLIRPFNLFDTVYVSIGGFFIITLFAVYLLVKTHSAKELYTITTTFFTLITVMFLFNLFMPFMGEQLFDFSVSLVGLIMGIVAYLILKDAKNAFIAIFLSAPVASVISFVINRAQSPDNLLFLGTGNFFEIAVIAFATCYVILSLRNTKFYKRKV